jgi:hypothetical protein
VPERRGESEPREGVGEALAGRIERIAFDDRRSGTGRVIHGGA